MRASIGSPLRSTLNPHIKTRRVGWRSSRPAEVGKDGENPTVIIGCGWQLEFREDVGDVRLDGLARHRQPITDGLVRPALRHQGEDFPLAIRQVLERDAGTPTDKDGYNGGIDDRAALGDPPDSVGEVVEIRDPILEQVADPAGSVAHQTQRERRLDM